MLTLKVWKEIMLVLLLSAERQRSRIITWQLFFLLPTLKGIEKKKNAADESCFLSRLFSIGFCILNAFL